MAKAQRLDTRDTSALQDDKPLTTQRMKWVDDLSQSQRLVGKECSSTSVSRGLGIARDLATSVIADARQAGISRVVLDTLGSMQAARALYAGLGFRPIPPYYENPLADVVYLGLDLGFGN